MGGNLDSKTRLLDLYDILESSGFILTKIFPKGLLFRKFEIWMENFQYSNYIAISNKIINKIND